MILLIAVAAIAARVGLARRPLLLNGGTLIVLFGAAALVDLGLSYSGAGSALPSILALGGFGIGYPFVRHAALLCRGSSRDLKEALTRSARMLRLGLEGGPAMYRIQGIDPPVTVATLSSKGRLHPLIFRGNLESPKTKLLRRVLAKQFGRLIPTFIRVRS